LARLFTGSQLVVASHNPGKVREIGDLIAPFGIETQSAGALGLAEPDETGLTFVENAKIKSDAAAHASRMPALADDSGLCVDALGGDPGIYSARWAGPSKDFSIAMAKIHQALVETGAMEPDQRRAHFVCALSLSWPDGHCESFEGKVFGHLVWPPRGDKGFGYDPMFIADGETMTFGEMEPDKKHGMSHRADAFKQLIEACFASG